MEKQDARTVTPEAQEQLRKQAIRLRKQGMSYIEISQVIGANRNSISIWCRQYDEHGIRAIRSKTRGVKPGTNRTLTREQEAGIQRCIIDKTPDQNKLSFALWTRKAVVELIRSRFGITMPVRTVGHYLQQWGFTPKKPVKQAYEQQPSAVKAWLEDEYPAIRERAKAENAEIHWGDETGIRSDSQYGRSYSPKGKTPVVRLSAKRTSINMISSITNQGKVRWMMYDGNLDATRLIKFLQRLIRSSSGRKLYLILDNLRVHHAKIVREWVAENVEEIEIFYLPSCSPELIQMNISTAI